MSGKKHTTTTTTTSAARKAPKRTRGGSKKSSSGTEVLDFEARGDEETAATKKQDSDEPMVLLQGDLSVWADHHDSDSMDHDSMSSNLSVVYDDEDNHCSKEDSKEDTSMSM